VKRQKLEALLSEHGCVKFRDKGKHAVWKSSDGALASVPRHNDKEVYRAQRL
jgi:predicted RNA binding protein YcfA (HicA-like mRNA interferase family)